MPKTLRVRTALLILVAVTLLAYWRSFQVPFQFDDNDQIVNNRVLRVRTAAELLSWGRSRILPYLSFALNFAVGGLDPFGYHVVNFAVHLVSAVLVFLLCLALCDAPRLRETALAKHRMLFALSAGLFFAVHPLQVQAVTYVIQRVAAMAAMFYLASVYFFVRGLLSDGLAKRRWAFGASALMALGAFFSKENSFSLPLALLLVSLCFFPKPRVAQLARIGAGFGLLALAIPLTWVTIWRPPADPTRPLSSIGERLQSILQAGQPSVGPLEYFFTQCTVLPRYLGLVLFPRGLNVDHDVPFQHGPTLPVLAGAALLVALAVFALTAGRRWPALRFAVLWFFVTSSIESSFLPIADPMVEHRMYLPMAGLAVAAGGWFCAAWQRFRAPAAIVGVALVAAMAGATIARNEVWRDPLRLWLDTVSKSPNKARVNANVGIILHQKGKPEEAIPYYCRALEIEPDSSRYRAYLDVALTAKLERLLEEDPSSDELVFGRDEEGNFVVNPRDPCRKGS